MSFSAKDHVQLASITEFPVYRIGRPNPLFSHLPAYAEPARLERAAFQQYSDTEHLFCQYVSGEPTAVVFEVVGRLRREDFFLTKQGKHSEGSAPSGLEASCWIEGVAEDVGLWSKWRQMIRAINIVTLRHTLQHPNRLHGPDTLLRSCSGNSILRVRWNLVDQNHNVSRSHYNSHRTLTPVGY